ncbi:MAG: TIM barrel protein [Acidobacteria bacterium]|nr:TIM barrel protein [Acidobacteriota bacterium]
MTISRRKFLAGSGIALTGSRLTRHALAAENEIKVGYHAITWGDNVDQAINEISELGFRGIQIRRADYEKYAGRVSEFKDLLAAKKLTVVSISTGNVTIKPETGKQELEDRLKMAKWMKDIGGLYLQATDGARAKVGVNDLDDFKNLGRRLTEIGKRTFGEHGIKLGFHNHMNNLGERREEFDRIMEATDPKHVWALLDIAHMQAAGGDPVKLTRDYIDRLIYPHFKDVVIHPSGPAGLDGKPPRPKYDFVELGQGRVNIPAVLQIMKDYRFKGWIIIELDKSPTGRTPKESAAISKKYVEEKLKLKV